MPSQRQTLSEYIKRNEDKRNSRKLRSELSPRSQNQNELKFLVDMKRKKVTTLMSDILYQVRRSSQNDQNLEQIEKLIKSTTQQIKNQFDELLTFSINSSNSQSQFSEFSQEQQPYKILINRQSYQTFISTHNIQSPQSLKSIVLKQRKSNKSIKRERKMKSQNDEKYQNLQMQRVKIINPLVRQRSHRQKQNSRIIQNGNGSFNQMKNPQDQFDYSFSRNILNQGFDAKQQKNSYLQKRNSRI